VGLFDFFKVKKQVSATLNTTTHKTHLPGIPSLNSNRMYPIPFDDESIFLNRCLTQKYFEEEEKRQYNDPAFARIFAALNSFSNARVVELAKELVLSHPDFDCIYFWWGTALMRMIKLDNALDVALSGLEHKAKKKFWLCNLLGEIELAANHIEWAVYWWSQGFHCQSSLKGCGHVTGAFLYLHYVAMGLSLTEPASAFLRAVDKLGNLRLDNTHANALINLTREHKCKVLIDVIVGLNEKNTKLQQHILHQ
jgi:hypothetical protein